ncbi:MAG: hypothetical protein GX811_08490, partial [Lentisphaerae bacterium]|nr:hypothetical protein [Lentisphaerota bacterium]
MKQRRRQSFFFHVIQTFFITAIFTIIPLLSALADTPPVVNIPGINKNFCVTDCSANTVVADESRVYLGGNFTLVGQPTGAGVPVATETGLAFDEYPAIDTQVNACVADREGGWYVVGDVLEIGKGHLSTIWRISGEGSVTDWSAEVDGIVLAMTLSSDGKTLYVATVFYITTFDRICPVYAIDTETGTVTDLELELEDRVHSMAISPDGKTLYIGGSFTSIGGQNRQYIVAFDTEAGEITAWNPNPNGWVEALTLSSDGSTLYVG